MSEKTYTISITYEATLTTDMSEEDIESLLLVGDVDIGPCTADEAGYTIEVDEE